MSHNEIDDIRTRNKRVEADKAWETSFTRRFIIALGTYIIVCAYLTFLSVDGAWLHAFVPPGAYIVSTLSLPIFKKLWLEKVFWKKSPKDPL